MLSHQTIEYDYEAADYDKSRFCNDLGRHLDYMHKKILGSFVNPSGKLMLDLGTGTGRLATWLAKNGFEVVGTDISREMLKKAKEKKELLNVELGLILADAHFLPFRKRLFDGCICINVIDHFSDADAFFGQVRHVIRSDGCLIFNFSNLQSPYLPIAVIVNSRNQALFKRGRVQSQWFTLREINNMISRNGFDIKEIRGCFIASPVPLGNPLVRIVQIINFSAENSKLKLFAGSPFIKAELTRHLEQ